MKKGQALVMVMLVMAVAATIGLSIATRSTSQVSVSTTQDESARALEAAEVGVEQALGGEVPTGAPKTITIDSTSESYTTNNGITAKQWFEWPYTFNNGDAAYLPLNGYDKKLRFCWGNGSGSVVPAIEIVGYYEAAGEQRSVTTTYDPVAARRGINNFNNVNSGCPTLSQYSYNTGQIDLMSFMTGATKTNFIRVRFLYNDTFQNLAADGVSNDLPTVANDIYSTGKTGMTTQKVHVTKMEADYPEVFGAAIFSGTSIVKHDCACL